MDFQWSGKQQDAYERVRRFAADQLGAAAAVDARDRTCTFDHDDWQKCAGIGLPGLSISCEYGGMGFDCLTTARALEGFGHGCHDAGLGFSLAAHLFACAKPIELYGTSEQKQKYLPRLCSGAWIGAGAITEKDAGSDAFAIETSAVRDGAYYIVSGEKVFVTNAPIASLYLVYAVTRPERDLFGISAFLVERGAPGVMVGEPFEKGGLTTAPVSALVLDGCRLHQSQLLGAAGAGSVIFHASIGWERCCLFALWLGAMQRQLDDVVRHAKTRRQFGRPIGANQAVSHKIANMKLRLESARLLLYRACWERAQGIACDLATSLAKIAVSEAFLQSSLDAVQIFGGAGIVREHGIERYVRDALPAPLYSGTNEMQRDTVARALGLPPLRQVAEP